MALCSLWCSILLWVERWGQATVLGMLMPTLCWKINKVEIKTQLSNFLKSQPPAFLLGKASLCPGYSWTSPTFLLYSLMYNYIWLTIFKFSFFIHCTGSQLWHMESYLQHVGPSLPTRNQTWALCIGSMESQPLDHQGGHPYYYYFQKFWQRHLFRGKNPQSLFHIA